MELIDKIKGSIIAGAVGDALGYAVEFDRIGGILAKHGPDGITSYELRNGQALVSDDTQMTLFTACGLLTAEQDAEGKLTPEQHIAKAYLEWYITQNKGIGYLPAPRCWIMKCPELYSRRAPGGTCLSALSSIMGGREPMNDSKGCGGIMRVAPVGLYGAAKGWPLARTISLGCQAAEITHQHPMGFLPAGLMAGVVQLVALRSTAPSAIELKAIVEEALDCLRLEATIDGMHTFGALYGESIDELAEHTARALRMAIDGEAPMKAIPALGEGWVGDEAWYIAIYCAARYASDPIRAIIAAVNHSGDSDSTGAIAGNIAGAAHGLAAIPEAWLAPLELKDVMLELSEQLATR